MPGLDGAKVLAVAKLDRASASRLQNLGLKTLERWLLELRSADHEAAFAGEYGDLLVTLKTGLGATAPQITPIVTALQAKATPITQHIAAIDDLRGKLLVHAQKLKAFKTNLKAFKTNIGIMTGSLLPGELSKVYEPMVWDIGWHADLIAADAAPSEASAKGLSIACKTLYKQRKKEVDALS